MDVTIMNNKYFISHSTKDDEFVKELRKHLEILGIGTWVDSRELIAGDKLDPGIEKAIEEADAFFVVFSVNAFSSAWIKKEVELALKTQKKKGDTFRIIPLMLEKVEPSALKLYFKEEPVGIKIKTGPGCLNEAMQQILAALGKRRNYRKNWNRKLVSPGIPAL